MNKTQLLEQLSRTFPFLAKQYRKYRLYRLSKKKTQDVFTDIYKKNTWQSDESRSGTGSTLESTQFISSRLPEIMKELSIRSMLDLPCGDYHWIKEINLGIEHYIGGDIVAELIQANNATYAKKGVLFKQLNLLSDALPEVDMLFCRDCLVHLSLDDNKNAISNILKSNIKYLMATTFPNVEHNEDIITGRWRKLNLEKPPFLFPKPIMLIHENKETNENFKCMGIWLVSEIKAMN